MKIINQKMNKKDLWLRLTQYHFNHLVPAHLWDVVAAKFGGPNASTKAFADKLTRKQDWPKQFAMKAIWEYKKFVYLGVTSDFNVTPSKVIDQVWHEHLLFSSGYRKFCDEVIEYDFDHNPELVPVTSQTGVFQAQYYETIALYNQEFGSIPPEDIWGDTKFDENLGTLERQSKKKEKPYSSIDVGTSGPLITMFPSMNSSDFVYSDGGEFGGGDFGGAGASGSWSDPDSGGGSDSDGSSCSSCSSGCGGGD
jgi:hypothetical protein